LHHPNNHIIISYPIQSDCIDHQPGIIIIISITFIPLKLVKVHLKYTTVKKPTEKVVAAASATSIERARAVVSVKRVCIEDQQRAVCGRALN
jgi:hypothetical protein